MRMLLEATPSEELERLFPACQRPGARTSRAELAPLLHLFLRGARESLLKIKREGYVNKIIERSDLPLTAAERAGTTSGLAVHFADQHTFYSFVAKICNRKAVLTEAEAEAGKMELLVYCGGDMHAAAAYGAQQLGVPLDDVLALVTVHFIDETGEQDALSAVVIGQ